jgi:hypothetical protein
MESICKVHRSASELPPRTTHLLARIVDAVERKQPDRSAIVGWVTTGICQRVAIPCDRTTVGVVDHEFGLKPCAEARWPPDREDLGAVAEFEPNGWRPGRVTVEPQIIAERHRPTAALRADAATGAWSYIQRDDADHLCRHGNGGRREAARQRARKGYDANGSRHHRDSIGGAAVRLVIANSPSGAAMSLDRSYRPTSSAR